MKRRDFIAAAAATAAAGTIPAAAATSDPDAAFLDLWRDFEAARAELAENSARYKAAYDTMPEWAKDDGGACGWPEWSQEELRAVNLHDRGLPPRLRREQVETVNSHYLEQLRLRHASPAILEIAQRENAARLEAFDRKIAERSRMRQAAGLDAIEAEGEEIIDRIYAAEEAIINRPAHGPLGLYVKMSLVSHLMEANVVDEDEIDPILADLRRMTGMGRLTPPADEEAEVTA